MAASPGRCMALRTLCRTWPRLGAGHASSHILSARGIGLGSLTCLGLRQVPSAASYLHHVRRLSDYRPPHVNYRSPKKSIIGDEDLHESPYTIPNALTIGRIIACPFLGYNIVQGNLEWATGILFLGGISDWLDGWIARRWNVKSVLGSILDPAADKALMTTLVGTLAWSGMLPLPLAILIFGRDLGLSISAFYFRFISLPHPRTLKRYFDPTIPSAEVKPTQISKINTALQLCLMGLTLINPLLPIPAETSLTALQWTVAITTVWSGFSYLGKSGVKILKKKPPAT